MISHEPLPWKKLTLWSILILSALLTAYILFVSIVSIWVGFTHMENDGFWMPVTAGSFSMLFVLWLFVRFCRFILHRMKEKDTINL